MQLPVLLLGSCLPRKAEAQAEGKGKEVNPCACNLPHDAEEAVVGGPSQQLEHRDDDPNCWCIPEVEFFETQKQGEYTQLIVHNGPKSERWRIMSEPVFLGNCSEHGPTYLPEPDHGFYNHRDERDICATSEEHERQLAADHRAGIGQPPALMLVAYFTGTDDPATHVAAVAGVLPDDAVIELRELRDRVGIAKGGES